MRLSYLERNHREKEDGMISEETRNNWKKKIDVIQKCYENGKLSLNDWEVEFINSVYWSFVLGDKDLSFKQSNCLRKIYERIE